MYMMYWLNYETWKLTLKYVYYTKIVDHSVLHLSRTKYSWELCTCICITEQLRIFFFCASGPRAGSTRASPGEGTGARKRPPWEGAQAERAGKGERTGTGEREPAKEGRMGEGSSETGRKGGKAERAASQRAAGEKGWEGEATQTTFAHKHATQVSFKLPSILDGTKRSQTVQCILCKTDKICPFQFDCLDASFGDTDF